MKTTLTTGYTFTPGTRTLDFSGYPGFDVKRLLGVVNATAGKLIYAPGLSGLGYTTLAAAVLTLAFDTATMNAADKMLVFYDDASPLAVKGTPIFTPSQGYVGVSVFNAADASGAGGTNGTVALVATATSATTYLSVSNNGTADAELWFGAIPANGNVGAAIKKGEVLPAGSKLIYSDKIPLGPVYATAASATGLSVTIGV